MKKKVSIVIPTYNRSDLVCRTIESCLNQTYQNIEVIVVNDGSKNDLSTYNKIDKYFLDKRFIYIEKTNTGLPETLNSGFRVATGEYFTWIADDNIFEKNAIELMVEEIINHKEPVFIYTDMKVHYIEQNELKRLNLKRTCSLNIDNVIGACFLFSKEIFERIGGYDQNFKYAEDYEYCVRVSEQFKMVHLEYAPYIYSLHEEAISYKYKNDVIKVVDKIHIKYNLISKVVDEIIHLSKNRPIYIWGTGQGAKGFLEKVNNFGVSFKGIIDSNPEKSGEKFYNLKIYSLSQITNENPYIIICSSTYRHEISSTLDREGYKWEKDYYWACNQWVLTDLDK